MDYIPANIKHNRAQHIVNLKTAKNLKKEIYDILGHEYVECGFKDERALQVDHIFGGGVAHGGNKSSLDYWREILKDPNIKTKYQILCANCNWIKRDTNHEVSSKHLKD